jgi:iron complex outermembrane receptor protein
MPAGDPSWRAALLALAAWPAALAGQGASGRIEGRITDAAADTAVAGAVVVIAGTQLRTSSDPEGRYRLEGLPPGRYDLRVVAIGYQSGERAGLVLDAGESLTVDLALQPAVVELPGLVVTAGGAAERAGESVVSVAVLGAPEIQQRNVITIDQALPFVAGMTQSNGEIDIRGASGVAGGVGSRVLFLLDGHPVLTGDGGEVDFDALPLLDLDRVEVVKGAYSALYGSAALGGVVNLITAPIGDRPASVVKLHAGLYDVPREFRFTDERLTFQGVDLQHSRRLGRLGARLAFAHETSDGFRQNGDFSRWFLRGKVQSPSTATHPWDAYAIWTHNDEGEYFVWRSPQAPSEVPPQAVGDREFSGKLWLGGSLTPAAGRSFLLKVSPHLTRSWVQNDFFDSQDYHRALRTGSTVSALFSAGARQTITAGLDASHTWVASTQFGDPRIVDAALFAQDEAAITRPLKVAAGLRLDLHKATGGTRELTLSPKIGLAWQPAPHWSARISAGHGYRAPSAIEQFVSATKSGFRVIPNPDLGGETAWSFEAGASGNVGGWLWLDAAAFQNEFRDLIGPAPAPGQVLVFQFRNVTRARVRGADLSLRAAPLGRILKVGINYLHLDARDLTQDRPLPYRSRHNVTGSLDLFGGLASLDLRYRTRVEEVLAYPLDRRTDITVVDLRLAYRVWGATLYAKVSNLLQAKYVDVMERTQGEPRSVLVTAWRAF